MIYIQQAITSFVLDSFYQTKSDIKIIISTNIVPLTQSSTKLIILFVFGLYFLSAAQALLRLQVRTPKITISTTNTTLRVLCKQSTNLSLVSESVAKENIIPIKKSAQARLSIVQYINFSVSDSIVFPAILSIVTAYAISD